MTTGKWYWEQTLTALVASDIQIGIGNINTDLNSYPGATSRSYGFSSNNLKWNNAASAVYTTSWVAGNVIGLAFDADAGTLTLYKNGVSLGTAFTGIPADTYFPVAGAYNASSTSYLNFGQRPFAYTAPSGYKALCTTNLPTPTITKPSTVMGVLTYTGNGASQVITGLGFSPDLVWIKQRSSTQSHCINDAVRGAGSYLSSDTTNAENSTPNVLTGFVPGGYTLGSEAIVNANTATYGAWCWDESASAGFDIVTYTGNGANRTIAHSLGVAPAFMVFKQRTAASTTSWAVWHSSLANTDYLLLNSTAATATGATYWNSTSPTSSVFSLGTAAAVNTNSGTYVGYLWAPIAGYSAMGSYTGNGSTDGTFVYTNMRPKFIMLKRTDTTSSWTILDTSRAGYNVDNNPLFANATSVEGTTDLLDIVSNGFKLRTTDISVNASGGTYLYVAFAEAPFSLARAR